MSEENKAVVRRLISEVFDGGRVQVVDDLLGEDFVDHTSPPGMPPGREGVKAVARMFREAFPDYVTEVEGMIAEDEYVAFWGTGRGMHTGAFMGVPGTGQRVEIRGIHVLRIRDGRVVEHRAYADRSGFPERYQRNSSAR